MVLYENGKIYKIVCNQTQQQYIGSTTLELLSQRLAKHVSNYKSHLIGKNSYISSFVI